MSDDTPRFDMAKAEVVYRLPGMERVTVRRDLEFPSADSGALCLDLYLPPEPGAEPLPVVVFVSGYPDPGFEAVVGCKFKEMGAYTSWARLVAASGLAALVCTNRKPPEDALALLRFVRESGASLGVDAGRVGLWACSGNVPTALWLLMQPPADAVRCAVLPYGFMLDLGGSTSVASASARFGFANPASGKTLDDLPEDLPFFIARAGRDENPGLNETIDRFAAEALLRDMPVTLVNCAGAPHAFDLVDDGETTRETIRQILSFLRFRL